MGYKTKDWRNSMRVTVDYNYMMAKSLGEKGIKDTELRRTKELAEQAFNYVSDNRGKDELFMGWTELPYNQDEIVADILATAKQVRKKFKYFVVLGIGGSALGPSMVFNALKHLHYNELKDKKRGGPKFYVEDNVDPVRMADLLDIIGRYERNYGSVFNNCRHTRKTGLVACRAYDFHNRRKPRQPH